MQKQTKKEILFDTVEDLVVDFLYYDRKEDEELRIGDIDDMIHSGEVTMGEILEVFTETMYQNLISD